MGTNNPPGASLAYVTNEVNLIMASLANEATTRGQGDTTLTNQLSALNTQVQNLLAEAAGFITNANPKFIGVGGIAPALNEFAAPGFGTEWLITSGSRQTSNDNVLIQGTLQGLSAGNTTPIVLTKVGGAAGTTNQINIPVNSFYAIRLCVGYYDYTSGALAAANNGTYINDAVKLISNNGGTCVVLGAGSGTSQTNGTASTATVTCSVDNTNKAMAVTFTPPTSNTDIWRVGAFYQLLRLG